MDKKRIILGLDVSTSCLGTSIVSYDGEEAKILYVHYVKMKSSKKYKGTNALFFKSQQFNDNFIQMLKDKGLINVITDIVIEEPLPGSQNVGTVNTLMKFNGMISQSIYEATGIMPQYISSYEARKYAFPDLMAIRKYNKKGEVYDTESMMSLYKTICVPVAMKQVEETIQKLCAIYHIPEIRLQRTDNASKNTPNYLN